MRSKKMVKIGNKKTMIGIIWDDCKGYKKIDVDSNHAVYLHILHTGIKGKTFIVECAMIRWFIMKLENKLLYLRKITPSWYLRRAYTMGMVTDIYWTGLSTQAQKALENLTRKAKIVGYLGTKR